MAQKTGLKVLHAIPGRVRLGVTGGDQTDAYLLSDQLEAIAQQLRSQAGILNVSANPQTGSLTVNFDRTTLSLANFLERLQQLGVLASAALPSQQPKEDFSFLQSSDFWQEQLTTIIPIVAGLLIVRALKLQGLWTIPVYVIAASFTRQLMQQVEKDFIVPLPVAETQVQSKVTVAQSEPQISQNGGKYPSIQPKIIAASQSLPADRNGYLGGAIAYHLAHAIPGRLRFHVDRVASDTKYARRLEELAQADPWVISLRINRNAASVTLTYAAGANKDTRSAVARAANLIQAAGEVAMPTLMSPLIPAKPAPTSETETDAEPSLEGDLTDEISQPEALKDDAVVEDTIAEESAIADSLPEQEVSEVTEQSSDITEETQSSDNEPTASNELAEEKPSILAPAVAEFYSRLKQCIANIVSRLSSTELFEIHPRDAPNGI